MWISASEHGCQTCVFRWPISAKVNTQLFFFWFRDWCFFRSNFDIPVGVILLNEFRKEEFSSSFSRKVIFSKVLGNLAHTFTVALREHNTSWKKTFWLFSPCLEVTFCWVPPEGPHHLTQLNTGDGPAPIPVEEAEDLSVFLDLILWQHDCDLLQLFGVNHHTDRSFSLHEKSCLRGLEGSANVRESRRRVEWQAHTLSRKSESSI